MMMKPIDNSTKNPIGLNYLKNTLFFDHYSLIELAKDFPTPLYIYSQRQIQQNWAHFKKAFQANKSKVHIHYAVKSNDRLAILAIYKKLGSSFDIVSAGELARLIKIGVKGEDIIFSGVGKKRKEIEFAIAEQISSINVESTDELKEIISVCQSLNLKAKIVLRVNPDIDAKTHPYIATGLKSNKFGLSFNQAFEIYLSERNNPHLKFIGVSSHIGSQITDLSVYQQSAQKIAGFVQDLEKEGIMLKTINLGGGIGIDYQNETTISLEKFAQMINSIFSKMNQEIIIEPGRSLIGTAGIFLTQILYLKDNQDYHFCIVDGSMSELIRPSLYQAYHPILPVIKRKESAANPMKNWQIVGPVCESSDVLGSNREMIIHKNDYLVITHTGAYGAVMSSNYNSRVKPAEILISSTGIKRISQRGTIDDLWRLENFDLEDV